MQARLAWFLSGILFSGYMTASSPAQAADSTVAPADLIQMEHCRLTLEGLKRFYEADDDLHVVAKRNPELFQKLNAESAGIDSRARMLQVQPTLIAALARHGLTASQFAIVEATIFQTVVALLAKQGGASATVLAGLHVNPANIALYEQHGSEIEQMRTRRQP